MNVQFRMAEITNLFKATVKTVKARQKAQGLITGVDKSILGVSHRRGEFDKNAKEVVTNITQLRDFLVEHRKDYINASSHYGRDTSRMTDAERDRIDSDAETYIKLCSESIKNIKISASKSKISSQVKEHEEAVTYLLEAYLKVVCSIYSEQRAIRVKRVVDRKRLSRLEPQNRGQRESFQSRVSRTEGHKGAPLEADKVVTDGNKKKGKSPEYKEHLADPSSEHDTEGLSAEEIQMFEEENKQLYEDMNSMVDEVKNIEGKVIAISNLQEVFAEKVLEQEKDIDRIADTVMGTTENIKEANEDIREAMKNNAGLRVWILFFLIVLSFSLLFLDWYNP